MDASMRAKLAHVRGAGDVAERTWREDDARQMAAAVGNHAFGRMVSSAREDASLRSAPWAGMDARVSSALARAAGERRPLLLRDPVDETDPQAATTGGAATLVPDADPADAGVGSRPDGGGAPASGGPVQTGAITDAGAIAGAPPQADAGAGPATPPAATPAPAPATPPVCAATATGVSLGSSSQWNDGTSYGLITPIIVRGTDLANVLDSELVGASIDHTGSMASRPSARSSNSGFQQADSIPDDRHGSGVADHLSYFDSHGGDGSYSRQQMDLFKIPSCGITTPQDMPNSGYRIKREVKRDGTHVKGVITKTAEAVSIDGHSSTPGLTAKREATITLR